MRESVYYGMLSHGGKVRGNNAYVCSTCGDMHKACYRKSMRRSWIYYIMPCHRCSPALFREHPQYANVDLSSVWVDLPEADQIARIERDFPPSRSLAEVLRMSVEPTTILQPEQASEPPAEEVEDDFPREP